MPTFDGGHYFLTVLIPISTKHVQDGTTVTSPVHALRKRLDMLPTTASGPASADGKSPSPFARNTRNHFARVAIIDDVAYNGRTGQDTLVDAALSTVLTDGQPQDHLRCPFLLVAVDFDAASGSDAERDSYLAELWNTMEGDLRAILTFCQGFDAQVKDAKSFAAYIAKCQLETTMSFNDYYIDDPKLPAWPATPFLWAGALSAIALLVGVVATLFLLIAGWFTSSMQQWLPAAFGLSIGGLVALLLVVAAAYLSLMAAGRKPFPAAAYATLPTVLKALHLQRVFTGFAIEHQMAAVGTDAASAQQLYDGFKAFLATNKPDDLQAPTQPPGVIGI